MNDQSEFKAALGDLLLLAKASGLKVTEPQIRECFPGWELTTEQWRLIYSYLELNQITVEGHESHPESLFLLERRRRGRRGERRGFRQKEQGGGFFRKTSDRGGHQMLPDVSGGDQGH